MSDTFISATRFNAASVTFKHRRTGPTFAPSNSAEDFGEAGVDENLYTETAYLNETLLQKLKRTLGNPPQRKFFQEFYRRTSKGLDSQTIMEDQITETGEDATTEFARKPSLKFRIHIFVQDLFSKIGEFFSKVANSFKRTKKEEPAITQTGVQPMEQKPVVVEPKVASARVDETVYLNETLLEKLKRILMPIIFGNSPTYKEPAITQKGVPPTVIERREEEKQKGNTGGAIAYFKLCAQRQAFAIVREKVCAARRQFWGLPPLKTE